MNGDRWGAEGPPPEAYSRVTNPKRFAPLHAAAEGLLDRLEREFDTERTGGYGLDPELEEGFKLARPSVSLVPRGTGAAPIVVAFSAFPGLRVRFGRWHMVAFPTCGCDACDETAESEIKRLSSLIDNVTAGRYRESLRITADRVASLRSDFGLSASALRESRRLIELAHGCCLQQEIDLRTTGSRGLGERRHEFPRIESDFLKFCEHSFFCSFVLPGSGFRRVVAAFVVCLSKMNPPAQQTLAEIV